MRKYDFDYNYHPEFSREKFAVVCAEIEKQIPGLTITKDYVDFLDGDNIRLYETPQGAEIRIDNDWLIGAVFVQSDIPLTL